MNLGVDEKTRKSLTLVVRQFILMMRSNPLGIRKVGRQLRPDPSMVSRELRRNRLPVHVGAGLAPLERANEAQGKEPGAAAKDEKGQAT